MKPSKHSLNSCEFSAKEITVEFIIVKESCDGSSPVKSRQSFPVKRGELVWDRLKERTYRRLLRSIGIRLSPTVKADLIELVSRVAYSLPSHADHIFVCIITSEPSHYAKFNVVTGIHVDEDKEVSWDTVENPLLHVLQACKPPIPCLKKVKIDEDNVGSNEASCCAICLQDFSAASEAATTTCSHVYHPHCIVKWLLKSTTCPMCRSKLPTGWFFFHSLGTQICRRINCLFSVQFRINCPVLRSWSSSLGWSWRQFFCCFINSAMWLLTFELKELISDYTKVVLIFSTRVVLFLLFFLYTLPNRRATRRAPWQGLQDQFYPPFVCRKVIFFWKMNFGKSEFLKSKF